MANSVTAPAHFDAPPVSSNRPYAPSWIDHLCFRIDRLPGPSWLAFVGAWAVLVLIDVVLRAQGNGQSLPTPFTLAYYATPIYVLWLMHTLDRLAGRALRQFYPALECDETTYRELRFRLTTMPARPVLLASVAGLFVGPFYLMLIPFQQQIALLEIDPAQAGGAALMIVGQIVGIFIGIVTGVFVYHTWHQLRAVNIIYREHTRVTLIDQMPLYAFANLSAATAIGMLVDTYAWSLASPLIGQNSLFAAWQVIFSIVCALTFIAPLIGTHNLLKAKRDERLRDVSRRLQQVTGKLYQRVDAGQVSDMDDLNKAIQSLELEYQIVKRLPTWPWSPETPRAFILTLLLPILLWLIEEVLNRLIT